jgi:hypothetical protein
VAMCERLLELSAESTALDHAKAPGGQGGERMGPDLALAEARAETCALLLVEIARTDPATAIGRVAKSDVALWLVNRDGGAARVAGILRSALTAFRMRDAIAGNDLGRTACAGDDAPGIALCERYLRLAWRHEKRGEVSASLEMHELVSAIAALPIPCGGDGRAALANVALSLAGEGSGAAAIGSSMLALFIKRDFDAGRTSAGAAHWAVLRRRLAAVAP